MSTQIWITAVRRHHVDLSDRPWDVPPGIKRAMYGNGYPSSMFGILPVTNWANGINVHAWASTSQRYANDRNNPMQHGSSSLLIWSDDVFMLALCLALHRR